ENRPIADQWPQRRLINLKLLLGDAVFSIVCPLKGSGFQSSRTSATSQLRTCGSRTFNAPGSVSNAACVQSTQSPNFNPCLCASSAISTSPCGNFSALAYQSPTPRNHPASI